MLSDVAGVEAGALAPVEVLGVLRGVRDDEEDVAEVATRDTVISLMREDVVEAAIGVRDEVVKAGGGAALTETETGGTTTLLLLEVVLDDAGCPPRDVVTSPELSTGEAAPFPERVTNAFCEASCAELQFLTWNWSLEGF